MPPAPTGRPDEMLGEHYRVERELGHGGMATVYLCTDVRDACRGAAVFRNHATGSHGGEDRWQNVDAFVDALHAG